MTHYVGGFGGIGLIDTHAVGGFGGIGLIDTHTVGGLVWRYRVN